MMHSAPRCTPTAETLGSIRTSAEPRPVRPASGLAMQLMASLDQRSPKRLVVTCVSATAVISAASAFARSVTRPSCSPILKPMVPVSVRMAWPGSYMPAPIVMTQPSVRCVPATAATRSSLRPFWKSTTTPSAVRYFKAIAVAHSVSYDLTAMKTASNGWVTDCSSWMCRALTGTRCSPQLPLRRRPTFFIASTCSGHWSTSVTSRPARVSIPPTTLPMAPAPMMPIRWIMSSSRCLTYRTRSIADELMSGAAPVTESWRRLPSSRAADDAADGGVAPRVVEGPGEDDLADLEACRDQKQDRGVEDAAHDDVDQVGRHVVRRSDLPAVDPVEELGARRLHGLLGGDHLDGVDGHEVVAVLVGGDALIGAAPATCRKFRRLVIIVDPSSIPRCANDRGWSGRR